MQIWSSKLKRKRGWLTAEERAFVTSDHIQFCQPPHIGHETETEFEDLTYSDKLAVGVGLLNETQNR